VVAAGLAERFHSWCRSAKLRAFDLLLVTSRFHDFAILRHHAVTLHCRVASDVTSDVAPVFDDVSDVLQLSKIRVAGTVPTIPSAASTMLHDPFWPSDVTALSHRHSTKKNQHPDSPSSLQLPLRLVDSFMEF